ncbi:hypothetical protein GCM10010140_10980 [Streptosporangium pseudovulgare]|uniref:Uncharacterized protein n=1 Tax=Streptosporangium pseudovulgare TaxID=35765 RepID=A0ABQ2QIT4_9ACTN|nr:hypothetical protein GCM10010140_10980 [Streptosporangium pseudovulgare]
MGVFLPVLVARGPFEARPFTAGLFAVRLSPPGRSPFGFHRRAGARLAEGYGGAAPGRGAPASREAGGRTPAHRYWIPASVHLSAKSPVHSSSLVT